mgnify:CR=1 FL=1
MENKREANRFINSQLFTTQSMKKLMKDIAPRFDEKKQKAGFTRVESIGIRQPDGASMAMIEILGNPIQKWEKQQEDERAANLGSLSFWAWELKVLKQEQQHFKDHLDKMQDKIEAEYHSIIGDSAKTKSAVNTQVKTEIEMKHAANKKFLLRGLKRAIIEEEIHMKQEHHSKYRQLDNKFGQSVKWNMNEISQPQRQ